MGRALVHLIYHETVSRERNQLVEREGGRSSFREVFISFVGGRDLFPPPVYVSATKPEGKSFNE